MFEIPQPLKTKEEVLEHFKYLRSEHNQEVLEHIDYIVTERSKRHAKKHPREYEVAYSTKKANLNHILTRKIPFYNSLYSDEIAHWYSEPFYLLEDMLEDWDENKCKPYFLEMCFKYLDEQIRLYEEMIRCDDPILRGIPYAL